MSIKTKLSDVTNVITSPQDLLVDDEGNKNRIVYFTADIPVEIISAAKLIPFRIPSDLKETGQQTNMTSILQPYICSKSHQFFDFVTKYAENIRGAIFSENHCDSLQNFFDVVKMKNSFTPNFQSFRYLLPTNRGGQAETTFYYNEMKRLISWFEEWTDRKISYNDLLKAIEGHNKKRKLLGLISANLSRGINIAEYLKLKLVTDLFPIEQSIEFLSQIQKSMSDTSDNKTELDNTRSRILVSGSMFDNYRLFDGIGILNQNTVGVDLSFISRTSDFEIGTPGNGENEDVDELLKNIAKAYIIDKIPDSVHRFPGRRKEHLSQKIEELQANGVIFIYYSFCDPDAFEVRSLSKYLEKDKGIATLTLVTDPQLTNLHQLTTRVEAFMEKIGEI
ncbi:MAG: 2-hydroxyacyl-CoA dehydratase [Candidatus Kariarchaeaceae archaeon]|jgi:benzoyl-CoA reductase/2-hydroxyglutaryl-CoA dehydratase subunit BcrC/BadD/HgdB